MTTRMFVFDTRPGAAEPERVVPFEGGIDKKGMKEVLDLLDKLADDHGRVHMVFELPHIPWVTPAAIFEKARHAGTLSKLKGRYAVVTNMKLMEKAMPLAESLTDIEGKVFKADQLQAAKDWAREG